MSIKLKVLVACEESQSVTREFRALGHEAFSCDIEPCSGGHPEWHYQQDVTELLKEKWDIVIAFPPCTYMTNGGAVRMYPKKGEIDKVRFQKAMEAKEFFMLFYNHKCEFKAIENPVPMSIIGLPKYSQIIQPYMFGDPFSKKTCLWLDNLPCLAPTDVLDTFQPFINGGGGRLNKPGYCGKKFANNSSKRSKTFEGIAKAMALQWSEYVIKQKTT